MAHVRAGSPCCRTHSLLPPLSQSTTCPMMPAGHSSRLSLCARERALFTILPTQKDHTCRWTGGTATCTGGWGEEWCRGTAQCARVRTCERICRCVRVRLFGSSGRRQLHLGPTRQCSSSYWVCSTLPSAVRAARDVTMRSHVLRAMDVSALVRLGIDLHLSGLSKGCCLVNCNFSRRLALCLALRLISPRTSPHFTPA